MSTVIIDRSLVGISFNELTSKPDVILYANALIESGADYVEIDLQTLALLEKPTGAENCVFRIGRAEEYQIANALPFAYAVVPLKLSYLIDKIRIPVILEINTGEADVLALLRIVCDSIDLSGIALLRLTGDFRQRAYGDYQTDEFPVLINKIKMSCPVPIDICPLNTTLGALSTAVDAYLMQVDSLTLSFGSNSNFASLEEFLISMATIYKIIISKNYISGICKASLISSMISDIETVNLQMLMTRYRLSPQKVELADEQPKERIHKYPVIKRARRKTLVERKLELLEVENGLSAEIADKLKKHSADFYRCESLTDGEKKNDCLH